MNPGLGTAGGQQGGEQGQGWVLVLWVQGLGWFILPQEFGDGGAGPSTPWAQGLTFLALPPLVLSPPQLGHLGWAPGAAWMAQETLSSPQIHPPCPSLFLQQEGDEDPAWRCRGGRCWGHTWHQEGQSGGTEVGQHGRDEGGNWVLGDARTRLEASWAQGSSLGPLTG